MACANEKDLCERERSRRLDRSILSWEHVARYTDPLFPDL